MTATRALLPFPVLLFSLGIAGPTTALSSDRPHPSQVPSHAKVPDLGRLKPGQPNPGEKVRLVQSYGRMPLSFEPNEGQTDGRVRFLARGGGYTIYLTDDEAVLTLRKPQPEQFVMNRLGRFGKSRLPGRLAPFSPLDTRSGRWPSLADNLESLWHSLIPDLSQPVPEPNTGKGAVPAGVESQSPQVVRMRLVGGNTNGRVVGLDQLPGRSNYFIGNDPKKWRTNVPNYAKVKYENVYPGVDLVYYGDSLKGGRLEYDFVVAPGANPNQIKLSFAGADGMRVDAASGDLVLKLGDDEVRFRKPAVYQPAVAAVDDLRTRGPKDRALECGGLTPPCLPELAAGTSGGTDAGHNESIGHGRRRQAAALQGGLRPQVSKLDGSFELASNNEVSFRMAGYDPKRALVIDPVLSYSTYLGGTAGDSATGIAVDSSGNAYVIGTTESDDFPTANPIQATCHGPASDCFNAFVAKLNAAGSALVYSTYLGGSSYNEGRAIAADSFGNAYVTGYTQSNDFPTVNPLQPIICGGAGCTIDAGNAFVAKLNPAGTALVYSTYLGGTGDDHGSGIGVDASGNAYVTGQTASTDFPTANPLQPSLGGSYNAFVTKLNSTGSTLVYSTYLGGSKGDEALGIAVDSASNAYVVGDAQSTDFPTANPLQATNHGGPLYGDDAFVAKLNAGGSALVYSTYLGGSGDDLGQGIAVDAAGNAYITGYTTSTDFPTANPLQATNHGGPSYGYDAFVAKLNAGGSALIYSTYLGGSGDDWGWGIGVDPAGNAYVTGQTDSPDFPTVEPLQAVCDNCGDYSGDAFVAKINPTGGALAYSTYLGGTEGAAAVGIAVDSAGNGYVTGITGSIDFPIANALQSNYGSSFVAKISPPGVGPSVTLSQLSLALGRQIDGTTSAPQTVTLTNTGTANLAISTVTIGGTNASDFAKSADTCTGATVTPNLTCTVSVTFTPSAAGSRSASLNFTDNASNSPQTVIVTGMGVATTPVASVSPSSLTFGNQNIGTTGNPLKATLTNTGSVDLIITGMGTTISGNGVFRFDSPDIICSFNFVPPGNHCDIFVTFLPWSTGQFTGTLTITDNSNGVAGSTQTVALSGTGTAPLVSLSAPGLIFGSQPVSTTSAAQVETLTNTGTGNLTMSTVTIGGTNASDFAMNAGACGTLAPNGTCTFSLTFTPTAIGSRSASLNFTDDASGSPQVVGLSGTGTAPTASLSAATLSFGSQLMGTTGAASQVTVADNGTAPLTFTSIAVTGDFALAANGTTCSTGAPVVAGANCVISVTFTPTATGVRSGGLTLTDNAGGSPQVVGLSGTGTAPSVSLSTTTLSFANQSVGTASTASTVTVTNNGTASLTFTGIGAAGDFAIAANGTTCSAGLPVVAGANCVISVTFTPTATGSRSGSLTLTDNASGSPQVVSFSGTGTAPSVSLSTTTLSFANQSVGTTSPSQPITLTNTGSGVLTPLTIATSGDFAQTNNCAGSVAASAGCTVSVTFNPTAPGTRIGTLTIVDNASDSPQTVTLGGTGTAPLVSLSAPSLGFGTQTVSTTSAPQVETLTNTGTGNLTMSTVAIFGTNASDFAKSADTCTGATVAPNLTCTVSVTFTPSASGSRSASMSFTDNASNSPQTVALTGAATIGPLLTVSPASMTFPAQYVGTTGLPQNVTLQNTGDQNATISNVQASSSFGATNGCTSSLAPQVSCTIGVFFDPTVSGNINGTLTITDNALGSPHTVTLSGTGQDFNFAPASGSSTSASVAAGQAATYALSMAGEGGLNQKVTLSCTGAPSEATCTVPSSVTVGSSATNVAVTVTTTAASVSVPRSRPLAPVPPLSPGLRGLLLLALVLAMMAWVIVRRNRPGMSRWRFAIPLLASGLLLAVALAGCGGGGSGSGGGPPPNPGTPAGTYTLTVTGSTGSGSAVVSHSVVLTLKVS